ncbi:MAG TPA: prepilin-type N-terminal cleavage/methylation domain-containing protein [Candidatus Faecisoma merdavium]|nr:prepilin-type N-terminal cleavage/methylation domain-containing protein [Candidatus Faecisoma merdavium]
MKKGFTLIELLAVIIILAIVALIATPIILDVVEDARKSAAKSEVSMILSGIQSYCTTEDMKVQMGSVQASAAKCSGKTSITAADVATMVNLGNAKVTDVTVSDGKYTFSVLSNGYKYTVTGSVIPESGTKTTTLQ